MKAISEGRFAGKDSALEERLRARGFYASALRAGPTCLYTCRRLSGRFPPQSAASTVLRRHLPPRADSLFAASAFQAKAIGAHAGPNG